MSFTISINDQAAFEVQFAGPAGPTGPQGPQGIPGVPGQGVPVGGTTGQILAKVDGVNYNTQWITPQDEYAVWGGITGTLSAQVDLQSALDGKYSTSNPAGFITSAALAGYATESWVTAGFYPLTGNPSGFLTSSALTPYLTISSAAATYQPLSGMSAYLTKAGNLSGLTSPSTARDNLQLGSLNSPTFAAITAQGAGANVAQYGSTAMSITHGTFGSISIQPSTGITFTDGTSMVTAFTQTIADGRYAPIAAGLPTGGTVGQVLTKNSSTNWDDSWQTLIPGDRYLTSSTTTLTINNQNKTLTVGTGLSYTPQQDVVISYDSANHMHCRVTSYNSVSGAMAVDVLSHTGTGTYSSWVVNVGGTVPAASVAWGSITGVLGNQADLAGALNAKANLAGGATFTGKVNTPTPTSTFCGLNIGSFLSTSNITGSVAGDIWIGTFQLTYRNGQGNIVYGAATNIANTFNAPQIIDTTNAAAALRVTQKGTGNAIEVEDTTTPDATRFVVDQFGKVGIGVAPDATAALKVDTNGIMFGDGTTQTTAASGGGSVAWGSITGTLSSQTDLVTELGGKADLSGATFSGDVYSPTTFVNNVQGKVLNAISSEIFNGMNMADYVSLQISNVGGTFYGSDPESPFAQPQTITFDVCCPAGLNNLIAYCTELGGSVVIQALNSSNESQATWSVTSFSSSNSFVVTADLFYGQTYNFYVSLYYQFPANSTQISQTSRIKIFSYSP